TKRIERGLRKSHLSGMRTVRSPSPLPSPSGRGSIIGNALDNSRRLELPKSAAWFSLSPRERAGVRGNGPWKLQTAGVFQLALVGALLAQVAAGQDALSFFSLSRDQFR